MRWINRQQPLGAEDQFLLEACGASLEGKTARQTNPHPRGSLGYGKPGPSGMLEGWKEVQARKRGAALMPALCDALGL